MLEVPTSRAVIALALLVVAGPAFCQEGGAGTTRVPDLSF
jgi:hypothetical protein